MKFAKVRQLILKTREDKKIVEGTHSKKYLGSSQIHIISKTKEKELHQRLKISYASLNFSIEEMKKEVSHVHITLSCLSSNELHAMHTYITQAIK